MPQKQTEPMPENLDQLSPLQRAVHAMLVMRARLDIVEQARTEPIAIVGMGCRFPGGADTPATYWHLLRDGVDTVGEIPPDRWDVATYYDPDPEAAGKMYIRRGSFLADIDQFDPQFFGISPREAASLDPQQRLLLEVSWEALEHAGLSPHKLAGSRTGVFVGVGQNDYAQLQLHAGDATRINAYDGTGNGFCFASGRLSHVLGLRGPNMSVDTACSSSLVALHLACQSLRSGESELALAGGVQLMLSPEVTIFLSRTGALAPDGRCKSFAADADGFGRGEGCGIIVLKRLSEAQADGDRILALIHGSAINHDGASSGLTVPNALAQEALIRQALLNAQVTPEQLGYVEAHGTGTALGDPIEMEALGAVFGTHRPAGSRLHVGSVKTNIGHLEAAAGIAGLLKVVLTLQHTTIPPNLHFSQPSPHIPWTNLPLTVPTQLTPWPASDQLRTAGVSSFGLSGANAFVVLQEAPPTALQPVSVERPLHLLTLSAKSEPALRELARRYASELAESPALPLGDVSFSANAGRAHFTQRLGVVAASTEQAQAELAAYAAGQPTSGLRQDQSSQTPKVAFLFTGQGSQYAGMGRELYETQPTFQAALDHCAEVLRPHLDPPLLEILHLESPFSNPQPTSLAQDELSISNTAFTQPALFALEYALAKVWQSWGVEPGALLGHSVGEIAAACVAGVFSLEAGLQLVAERGRLMGSLPHEGEMVAVFADPEQVAAAVQPYADEVRLAALNGPHNVVISGRQAAVRKAIASLEAAGVQTKRLNVSHAFHSPLMEPMLADFRRFLDEIEFSAPHIGIVSNLTGAYATTEFATPDYWLQQAHQPVRFAAGIQALYSQGYDTFVEIGPRPTLLGLGRQCLPEGAQWAPSLRPGRSDWQQMLQSLSELYVQGVDVDWDAFDSDYSRQRLPLPTYPFQRRRYWVSTAAAKKQSSTAIEAPIAERFLPADVLRVVQQLEESGQFSADELKLLPRLLDALHDQHAEQTAQQEASDLLYEIAWRSKPRQAQPKFNEQPCLWLILADTGGVGAALAARLEAQGQQHSVLVYAADDSGVGGAGERLDPANRDDFERLLRDTLRAYRQPLRGVIHLWGLDATPASGLDCGALQRIQLRSCVAGLHLLQALLKHGSLAQTRLWFVTRNATPIESDPNSYRLALTPLWGFGRVIALEHPQLWGGLVDLPAASEVAEADALLAEIWDSEGEDQIALRPAGRYVARLTRSRSPASGRVAFRADGTYLICGGLGALGLHLAKWIAARGAGRLVLTGRRGIANSSQKWAVDQLRAAGIDVLALQADVADESAMTKLFSELAAAGQPLRGVFHAAGVPGYQTLAEMTPAALAQALRPKAVGAWNLHRLTQGLELDYFVCFSSIASAWGSKAQAHYAAANHFLDALAHYRRSLGLTALSVNWGPWTDGGMTSADDQALLKRMGVNALSAETALAALGTVMETDAPQHIVADVEWKQFKELYELQTQRLLLQEIEAAAPQAPKQPLAVRPQLRQQLAEMNERERHHILVAYLSAAVGAILGFESGERPDPQQGFAEMGLDSLMAVELRNRLQADLGFPLTATLAFDYPNIGELADFLGQLGHAGAGNGAEPLQADPALAKLSENEVEATIAAQLEKLEALVRES